MKFVVCLLVLLPIVYSASIEERFIFGSVQLHLSDVVVCLQKGLCSGCEAACEASCPSLLSSIPGGSLVAPFLCAPACKELIQQRAVELVMGPLKAVLGSDIAKAACLGACAGLLIAGGPETTAIALATRGAVCEASCEALQAAAHAGK